MIDLFEIFDSIISQSRSVDVAESEFRKQLYEDEELLSVYKEWCEESGYTEKKGFIEYCHQYYDAEESKWDILNNDYE